jgi:hypothetical protein
MSVMTKVQLVTLAYGTEDDVCMVEVPKFNKMPDVLVWGVRYFVPHRLHGVRHPIYKEVFGYSVPEPVGNGN